MSLEKATTPLYNVFYGKIQENPPGKVDFPIQHPHMLDIFL